MLDILLYILAFIVIFSILILVHEFGHFITAKKSGVKVEEFGMGLPPRAVTLYTDKAGTIYSLNWIPFGGFVRMQGEDAPEIRAEKDKTLSDEEREEIDDNKRILADPQSFVNKVLWKRMLIVTAGVIMNFLLAIVLLSIVFTVGFYPLSLVEKEKIPLNSYIFPNIEFAQEQKIIERKDPQQESVSVENVEENSIAAQAGFQSNDIVLKANDQKMDISLKLINTIRSSAGKEMTFLVQRGESTETITLTPVKNKTIGLRLEEDFMISPVRFDFPTAVVRATQEVASQSYITLILAKDVVLNIFQKAQIPEGVAGPVGIASMTGTFVKMGLIPVLIFIAMLSISLGVMNILPIPALDGGRFLFMVVELITRKKPSARLETAVHGIGYVLLLLLILVITGNDILKLWMG